MTFDLVARTVDFIRFIQFIQHNNEEHCRFEFNKNIKFFTYGIIIV